MYCPQSQLLMVRYNLRNFYLFLNQLFILDEDLINHVEEVVQHLRSKRATCDILSGFGVNHSACAIHCVLRFRGGGHCNARGVCICR